MKNLNMKELYNPEIKEQFLINFDATQESKYTMYYALKRAGKSEKLMKKDLYDMTASELESVFYTARRTSESSMRGFISNISSYIKWATREGYRDTLLPVFTAESMASMAHKYVWNGFSEFYTQEDLFEHYKKFKNKSDTLIIQCIFEGIRGQGYSEIFSLKEKDLFKKDGKFYVNLFDTEKGIERPEFEISEFLYELMLNVADSSTIYDVRGKELELIPSQYILKKTSKGNKGQTYGEKLTTTYLMNKPQHYKRIFESDDFSFRNVEKSGVMHYLNSLLNGREERLVTFDDYKKISDKFNAGKYKHAFYKEDTVNYTAIRELIDIEFFEEHYGEIELM